MNYYKEILWCQQHPNQETEPYEYPEVSLFSSFWSLPKGNYHLHFYHQQLIIPVSELYINEIVSIYSYVWLLLSPCAREVYPCHAGCNRYFSLQYCNLLSEYAAIYQPLVLLIDSCVVSSLGGVQQIVLPGMSFCMPSGRQRHGFPMGLSPGVNFGHPSNLATMYLTKRMLSPVFAVCFIKYIAAKFYKTARINVLWGGNPCLYFCRASARVLAFTLGFFSLSVYRPWRFAMTDGEKLAVRSMGSICEGKGMQRCRYVPFWCPAEKCWSQPCGLLAWVGRVSLLHPTTPFPLLLDLVPFDCSHSLEEMDPRDEFANNSIIFLWDRSSSPRLCCPWRSRAGSWESHLLGAVCYEYLRPAARTVPI